MRAIGVTRYGGPEMLEVLDLPAEPLGSGQVRIRVSAAAVNPTDTGVRAGLRAAGDQPDGGVDVPGMDVAGHVVEIAPDVDSTFTEGQPVMGIVVPSGPHGGYREDLVLPSRSVAAAPTSWRRRRCR